VERTYQIKGWSDDRNTRINVDSKTGISAVLKIGSDRNLNKEFCEILEILKENLNNSEKYRALKTPVGYSGYYEMIFTSSEKKCILCREYSIKKRREIVIIELFEKVKGKSIQKSMIKRIKEAGGFDYDFN